MSKAAFPIIQRRVMPEPSSHIPDGGTGDRDAAKSAIEEVKEDLSSSKKSTFQGAMKIRQEFYEAQGNICDLLSDSEIWEVGEKAVSEWRMDLSSIEGWRDLAEQGLALAAQESDPDGSVNYPWDDASNVHLPFLTVAAQQWAARAYPELVSGDKVVGVKIFSPPAATLQPGQIAQNGPQPQNPQDAQASQMALQQDQQKQAMQGLRVQAMNDRGTRVSDFMNYLIFYKMKNWEGDTDLLLNQLPITGSGFKKVYMSDEGLKSEYISPLNLTVHANTKSMQECPRITHDFEMYPYQLNEAMRSGRFNDVDLSDMDDDDQRCRQIIEQHRFIDLDYDGLAEPYIVTVDVESQQVLRIELAYDSSDITINDKKKRVIRIERWNPFPDFKFLPDPKGNFYATGFAKLLDPITDSIDTAVNQLMDAGNAQIAGGGLISSSMRFAGSGQGGSMWFRPGEYKSVTSNGGPIQDGIWERTVPGPSEVTMQLLPILMDSCKEIASIKDVMTGDGSNMAAVGTTLAMQDQALKVYSSIYKRVYRGFREEFRLMYKCIKKFADDNMRALYTEISGGDLDQDFKGDGNDVQPVADPTTVSKVQKITRMQGLVQLAESPLGQAAGMTLPTQAQNMCLELMETYDIERPQRFMGQVPPNQAAMAEQQAKIQQTQADANLKAEQAKKMAADADFLRTKSIREMGLVALDNNELHEEAHGIHSKTSDELNSEPLNIPLTNNPSQASEGNTDATTNETGQPY